MSPTRIVAVLGLLAAGTAATVPLLLRRGGTSLAPETTVTAAGSGPRLAAQVVPAELREIRRTVRLTGTFKSGDEVKLSPKQGGKIAAVLVREGDRVRAGQVVLRLDRSDTQRQAEQANAGVAAARAQWEKAVEGERLKRIEVESRVAEARRGVEQARSQVEKAEAGHQLQSRVSQTDIAQAEAGVTAAKSALAQAKRGARPEQKRQAEIGVEQAKRGVGLAKRNLDDLEKLYARGGVPRVQVDQAREQYQKAVDGQAQAQAQLDLLEAGATAEEIAAAESQVKRAEAALAAARAGADRDDLNKADLDAARSRLKQAEEGLQSALASRREMEIARSDVRSARADYDRALAGARLAGQQVEAAVVTSPVDGVVSAVNVSAGEMAGPGHPLVVVTSTAGVYLEAALPARLLASVRPGQGASVSVDVAPGRRFAGVVRSIGRTAGPDGRSFPVQIDVSAPAGVLRPDAYARAEVTIESHPNAVTVPTEALRTEDGEARLWLVRDGQVAEVTVDASIQDERGTMVRGDVRAGEMVIVSSAPGLRPGNPVTAQPAHRGAAPETAGL